VRIEPQVGPTNPHKVVFHPKDPSRFLVLEDVGAIGVWKMEDGEKFVKQLSIFTTAKDACFVPDEPLIVTAGLDGKLHWWNEDGKEMHTTAEGHTKAATAVAIASDGKLLASTGEDGAVRLWKTDGSAVATIEQGHIGGGTSVVFAPNNELLASAGKDGVIRFWKKEGKPHSNPIEAHGKSIWQIAFSPRSDLLAAVDGEFMNLWDLQGIGRGEWKGAGSDELRNVSFSPNSDKIAFSGGHGVNLWFGTGTSHVESSVRRDRETNWSTFSPDGKYLVTAEGPGYSSDAAIRFTKMGLVPWDHPPFLEDKAYVHSVAFSRRRETFAWGCSDGTIQFRDLRGELQGEPIHVNPEWKWKEDLKHLDTVMFPVVFSPTDDLLASAGPDSLVRLWNLDGSPHGGPLRGHEGQVQAVAFAPGGKLLASGDEKGMIRLWTTDGVPKGDAWSALAGKPLEGSFTRNGVLSLAFSPKGDLLASAGDDGLVRLWDLDGKPRGEPLKGHTERVCAVAFSQSGDTVASASSDGTVRLWNLDGSVRKTISVGEPVFTVAFSPYDDCLVAGGEELHLWTMDGTPIGVPAEVPHALATLSIAFSTQRDLLATAGITNSFAIWDVHGSQSNRILNASERLFRSIAVSEDGQTWWWGDWKGNVVLHEINGTTRAGPFKAHNGPVDSLAYCQKDGSAASVGRDNSVQLWNSDGTKAQLLPKDSLGVQEISAITFAPDKTFLAIAGSNRLEKDNKMTWEYMISLWPLNEKVAAKVLHGKLEGAHVVAYSATGKLLASLSRDGTVRLWDVSAGKEHGAALTTSDASGNSYRHLAVAFSSDDDLVATAGSDGKIRLWKCKDGTPGGQVLTHHNSAVTSVAFGAGDSLLLTGSSDGTLRLSNRQNDGTFHETQRWDIGIAVDQAGFSPKGVWVRAEGNSLFFADRILRPTGRLVAATEGRGVNHSVVTLTEDGWYSGSGDLAFGGVKGYREGGAPLTEFEITQHSSPENVTATLTADKPWWQPAWHAIVHAWRQTWAWYDALPKWLQVAIWPCIGYGLLASVMTGLWLFRADILARWAMPDLAAAQLPDLKDLKGFVLALTLVRWLGGTQRALDAWLRKNQLTLRQRCFEGKENVIQRAERNVDLGNEVTLSDFASAVRDGKEVAHWITGNGGGAGKSHLAFRLARVGVTAGVKYTVLPVLIEENWEKDKLLQLIANQLRIGGRKPATDMIRLLLHTGRIILIVDGLSERQVLEAGNPPTTPTDQVLALLGSGGVRHLLVTSRDSPPRTSLLSPIQVGGLDPRRLWGFVQQYATDTTRHKEIYRTIIKWRRNVQQIRPLFAKMAIECLAAAAPLPATFPALVEDYLRATLPLGGMALREDDFLRAARLAAFVCFDKGVVPQEILEDLLRGHLTEVASADPFRALNPPANQNIPAGLVIDQLISCGLLRQRTHHTYTLIRFAEDTIAEYLAALYLTRRPDGRTLAGFKNRTNFSGSGVEEALAQLPRSGS
jgi:WD40 repeat protein